MIKLCSLLCKAQPTYLMTSAGMLSGPAALLSLRLRMTFDTSSNDGGSSSFGVIGSVGRSSKKPGSMVRTLFSRFCGYSAHHARINSLFLIRMPSVLTPPLSSPDASVVLASGFEQLEANPYVAGP